jgi:hypothetical protein
MPPRCAATNSGKDRPGSTRVRRISVFENGPITLSSARPRRPPLWKVDRRSSLPLWRARTTWLRAAADRERARGERLADAPDGVVGQPDQARPLLGQAHARGEVVGQAAHLAHALQEREPVGPGRLRLRVGSGRGRGRIDQRGVVGRLGRHVLPVVARERLVGIGGDREPVRKRVVQRERQEQLPRRGGRQADDLGPDQLPGLEGRRLPEDVAHVEALDLGRTGRARGDVVDLDGVGLGPHPRAEASPLRAELGAQDRVVGHGGPDRPAQPLQVELAPEPVGRSRAVVGRGEALGQEVAFLVLGNRSEHVAARIPDHPTPASRPGCRRVAAILHQVAGTGRSAGGWRLPRPGRAGSRVRASWR